jgi:uncharacterized damage-inducible protein DinB
MNDDLVSLYAFHRWAERKMLDACRKLTYEQYAAAPAPGWSSIRSSIVHMANATEGWIRALNREEVPSAATENDLPAVDDVARRLEPVYAILDAVLPGLTREQLITPRTFSGRGSSIVVPPWTVLRHVVNHATYHRGQVASKLKRFGIDQPATDLVFWAREQTPQQG